MPMRLFAVLWAILWPLATSGSVSLGADPWISLFNGKNLDGWRGDPTIWSVENGVIQGSTEGVPPLEQNTFLTWSGEGLSDFDLHAEFRIIAGNSGIQYRSRVVDESKYSVVGYQADIDAAGTYTGILYEEGGRGILALRGQRSFIASDDAAAHVTFAPAEELLRGISAKQWNTYEIEARGCRLRHRINGRLMSETEDHSAGHAARTGTLALQVHRGPPMIVQFRNLRVRRHSAGDPAKTASAATSPLESATPADALVVPSGFKVELLYSVPTDQDVSWVSLAVDPRGRLVASDQDGRLFRIVPAAVGSDPRATFVEPLPLKIGSAQGMCFVDDRLYVVVNSGSDKGPRSGLYRVEDSDADGELDAVMLLRLLDGEGEHGPHAVIPSPTGDQLFIVAGNHTKLPALTASKVPTHWGEDQLLHRLWDARGHAVGILAPGGWICATDLAGQDWELFAIGFRNAYDLAFDETGELFTFDSDMEWDIGAPWYRPTRVCHVTSGAEFGWRSGSGKWSPSFPDSLPPVLDHGPGSPTGVTFGYDTGYPDEYRRALFIGDWSFGRIDCVQLTPRGGSFDATATPFVTGTPLPVTDIVANRHDGALYFAIGGRKTQSGLYRVSYQGPVATSPAAPAMAAEEVQLRAELESLHGKSQRDATAKVVSHLSHPDRFVRYAARVALEWQPIDSWEHLVLAAEDPVARIEGCVALARCSTVRDSHRVRSMFGALLQIDWNELAVAQKLAWLRACELVLIRTDCHDAQVLHHVGQCLLHEFPTGTPDLDMAMGRILVYCRVPAALPPMLESMYEAPTQQERIAVAYNLRSALPLMSSEQQSRYLSWFGKLDGVRGGESLRGFLRMIRDDAATSLDDAARQRLAPLLAIAVTEVTAGPIVPTGPVVEEYSIDRVVQIVEQSNAQSSLANARAAFAKALCFHCHRVGDEGGATGPDLTTAHRRFSVRYLAESMVSPDLEISDRFRTSTFLLQDGQLITGRVANMNQGEIRVVTDMLNPGAFTAIERTEIEEIQPSPASEMPKGLLNVLTPEEIRDLFCYLRSEGKQ